MTFVVVNGYQAITPNSTTAIIVTVKEHGGVITYDGYEHHVSGYDLVSINNSVYTASDFHYGGTISDSIAKGRYVGNYQMNIQSSDFIKDNLNYANVSFVVLNDSLVIKPNPSVITIIANSASKLYDGTPLVDSGYTYTPNDIIAMGDTLVAEISGSITEVGQTDNIVADYRVYRNESFNSSMIKSISAPTGYLVDVTNCYTFATEMVKGVLTVYDTLAITVTATSEPLCPGTNEGTASITVTGGQPATPKYTYLIEGAVTHDTYTGTSNGSISLSSLRPDTYTVKVTESMGNTATTTFAIAVHPTITTANSTFKCPDDINQININGGCSMEIINIGTPTFSTTTGIPMSDITIYNNAPTDNMYPAGETTIVKWVVKGPCGDSIVCEQLVKISFQNCPLAIDHEQNTYPSVRVGRGCKCWTTENLVSTQYSDGRPIDNVMDYYSREYPNTAENVSIFGHLYHWYAAADTLRYGSVDSVRRAYEAGHYIQGICPENWHLPSDEEFEELNVHPVTDLRSTSYWINVDGVVNTNATGFNSLPGGKYNCATDRFEDMMGNAYYWTCHPVYDMATGAMIDYICEKILINNNHCCNGYSIRCIWDEH